MSANGLPLKEVSIRELYMGGKCTYEIPVYQRNYAWGRDEITALVQDVYDSFTAFMKGEDKNYYIGTLVSYHKGDQVYEVIDGQQRLTTIWLILKALSGGDGGIRPQNRLTYRARKKSDRTLKAIFDLDTSGNARKAVPDFDNEEKDAGIESGYNDAWKAIEGIDSEKKQAFTAYFLDRVHIIHYQVPRDIDLNHYFEIMNSRGEQLEKHEIEKAELMHKLDSEQEQQLFNSIWECCSEMSVYVQQTISGINAEEVFGQPLDEFIPEDFEALLALKRAYDDDIEEKKGKKPEGEKEPIKIEEILDHANMKKATEKISGSEDRKDSFQPIIDFPNFLLIVLKLCILSEDGFPRVEINLDDKGLLDEFKEAEMDAEKVRKFAFNLLKARFYLDNYIVHHAREEDTIDSNPWKLQVWCRDKETNRAQLRNLCSDTLQQGEAVAQQNKLVQLLSMFEVSFSARQRKNYLLYLLLYLMKHGKPGGDQEEYARFAESLADKYFYDVYLEPGRLNEINTPVPRSFDEAVLAGGEADTSVHQPRDMASFNAIYGDGTAASRGIPLFIFNYLDYKLWESYYSQLRGSGAKRESGERAAFFEKLGCSDFGLETFEQFFFSRTRRSLEHYYPQANATGEPGSLNQDQINCLGNYAMIGSGANSSGSNWTPETKRNHYLDPKISRISIASLKFMVMLQICKDKEKWTFEEIQAHQNKMLGILFEKG